MPETIVKTTTVYKFEELEALGWRVKERATQKMLELCWECWEPSWFTDDIKTLLEEDWSLFDLSDKTLEWDLDRLNIEAKGSVNLTKVLTQLKLRNKYRALWYVLKVYLLDDDIPVTFGHGSREDIDTYEFERSLNYIDDLVGDIYAPESPRLHKIRAQIDLVKRDIYDYLGNAHDAVIKLMRAELDYLNSEEFVREECEANEIRFTEDGNIYR